MHEYFSCSYLFIFNLTSYLVCPVSMSDALTLSNIPSLICTKMTIFDSHSCVKYMPQCDQISRECISGQSSVPRIRFLSYFPKRCPFLVFYNLTHFCFIDPTNTTRQPQTVSSLDALGNISTWRKALLIKTR